MTFKEAAYRILSEAHRPLSVDEITEIALQSGHIQTNGLTPRDTLRAMLCTDIDEKKVQSKFVKLGPNLYGLAKWDYKMAFIALEQLNMAARRMHLGAY